MTLSETGHSFDRTPDEIRSILRGFRVVAIVGLSPEPSRPSHGVAAYLMSTGYRVVPINPAVSEILGKRAHADLRSVPCDVGIEIVDVFRRPEAVLPHVEEAIEIGAKVVWLQKGVINAEAAERARSAGLTVVMDKCMLEEHEALIRR
jgi:predicted CoA-binding protein